MPTGTVTFTVNGTVVATVPLSAGAVSVTTTVTGLAAGTYTVVASYSGDTRYLPSTSPPLSLMVNPAPTTTTSLVSPNPSDFGQAATFTANVMSGVPAAFPQPTGSVSFSVDGMPVGSAPIMNGVVSFPAPAQLAGPHTVVASYSGDTNYQSSAATAVIWTVNPAATALAVAVNPNPSAFGQPATLTANLAPFVPGGTTPAHRSSVRSEFLARVRLAMTRPRQVISSRQVRTSPEGTCTAGASPR